MQTEKDYWEEEFRKVSQDLLKSSHNKSEDHSLALKKLTSDFERSLKDTKELHQKDKTIQENLLKQQKEKTKPRRKASR